MKAIRNALTVAHPQRKHWFDPDRRKLVALGAASGAMVVAGATAAADAPGSWASVTTCRLNSSVKLRRGRFACSDIDKCPMWMAPAGKENLGALTISGRVQSYVRPIVAAHMAAGASAAAVARRHDLNANLLFTWKRRYGMSDRFLPVEVSEAKLAEVPMSDEPEERERSEFTSLEIELANGNRIR